MQKGTRMAHKSTFKRLVYIVREKTFRSHRFRPKQQHLTPVKVMYIETTTSITSTFRLFLSTYLPTSVARRL